MSVQSQQEWGWGGMGAHPGLGSHREGDSLGWGNTGGKKASGASQVALALCSL